MRERTTAEWRKIFDGHGIPGGEVKLPMEMLDDPQPLANGMFHDLPHPQLGPVRMVAPPVKLDADGFRPGPATASFGSEVRRLLRELGFSADDVAGFIADGVTCESLRPPSRT